MKDSEYLITQKQLCEAVDELERLDLDAFIERAEIALAAGPVLNPTLYRMAEPNLSKIMRIAEAARSLVCVARRDGTVT